VNFTPYSARPSLKNSRFDSFGCRANIRTRTSLMNSVEHTNVIDVRSAHDRSGRSTRSIWKSGAPSRCVALMCSGEWMCWMPAAYGMRSKS
jgi:hypothetical protein